VGATHDFHVAGQALQQFVEPDRSVIDDDHLVRGSLHLRGDSLKTTQSLHRIAAERDED
jgi:hypothetical protein